MEYMRGVQGCPILARLYNRRLLYQLLVHFATLKFIVFRQQPFFLRFFCGFVCLSVAVLPAKWYTKRITLDEPVRQPKGLQAV